jgi:hypothetical protein
VDERQAQARRRIFEVNTKALGVKRRRESALIIRRKLNVAVFEARFCGGDGFAFISGACLEKHDIGTDLSSARDGA